MLFVIGHMRTGSSLLVHLLASHRDILGYGETHKTYTSPEDLGVVTASICRHLRKLPFGSSYVLDKVLHKRLIACPEMLCHPSVRVVFIVRKPSMALSSMIRTKATAGGEEAYQHYIQQIEWVRQLAQQIPPVQWTHTTYSELVRNTATVFDRLERFLDLSEPLSERYQTTHLTGVRGVGDSGPHIGAGRIKRDIDRDVVPEVQGFVEPAEECFERCLQALEEHNQHCS